MSDRMNELYILTQKAQKMEMINEELALQLYLDIFEHYTPKISKTYESAIRLLEKRQRCPEALAICNKAIELIKADEISGLVDRFETIKERLERKIQAEAPPEPEKKRIMIKRGHVLFLIVALALIWLLFRYTSPHQDLDVDLTGKEGIEGQLPFVKDNDKKDPSYLKYPVTDAMIATATAEIEKLTDVSGASVIPQEETLGIAIIVKPGTNEERSKAIATLYLKALSGAAAAAYSDLKGPSDDSLGDLYTHYELIISVGTSQAAEDFTANGTKNKSSKAIYWRKLD